MGRRLGGSSSLNKGDDESVGMCRNSSAVLRSVAWRTIQQRRLLDSSQSKVESVGGV